MFKIGDLNSNNAIVNLAEDNEVKVFRVTNPVAQPISNFALYLAQNIPGHFASIGLYNLALLRVVDSGPIPTNPGNTNIITANQPEVILPAGDFYFAVTASSTDVQLLGQGENAEAIALFNGAGIVVYGRAANKAHNGQLPLSLGDVLPDSGSLPGAVFA